MIQGIGCVFKIPLVFWGKVHAIVLLRRWARSYSCCFRGLQARQVEEHEDLANCLLVSFNSRGGENILKQNLKSQSVFQCVLEDSVLSFSWCI